MACSTRSSSKSKNDENNNARRSGSSAPDANDLKRSAEVFSIPSATRKSERLLKSTTPTITKRRKFERFEKPKMPSPTRKSERIKKHSSVMTEDIAHKCQTDSFSFVEYWLPVQISQVQLEQYCSTLVSNASVLRSSSKIDSVGALQDLLISNWKCCNHPYVVDPYLQTLLTKGLQAIEYVDVGIKASGKLQALDSMLMELKKKGLRVLILFQSIGGSGKDSIGDILDDFLHQRFGSDAYERVDKGVLHSKKLSALNLFNNNDSGRFIFLLESWACVPSIKLSSVDTIIIFNSDWNPVSDIRSLQRITLDSQSEQIKIFRLYSCFTVEEKTLILAKQGKTLDSNLLNMSWNISHILLMWGSSCLFDNLRLILDGKSSSSCSNYSFEDPGRLSKEVLHEFSSVLLQDSGYNDTSNCSIILKVQLNEGTYCTDFALFGEKKLGSPVEGLPHMFWTELLKGKVPQWKHARVPSQRGRRRAHHAGGSVITHNLESEEIARKRRKVINSVVDEPPSNFQGEKSSTGNEEGNEAEYEKRKLCDEQKSLHLLLMPEIAKLCEILLLPDNVTTVVYNFLEYIMNNHHIRRQSESILQAFQISLCWTAASLLKHKINHKVSLMLAREHLKFDCRKEEADYVYSMLRCLKKIFLHRAGNSNAIGFSKPSKSPNKVYSCTGVAPEVELAMEDIAKSIKEIQKKCQKKLRKLLLKQDEEKNKLNEVNEEKKAVLREKYKIELAVIHFCFSNDAMRSEKLKILDKEFAKGIEDLECQNEMLLKNLEATQLEAKHEFQRWEATWIEKVKDWAQDELKIFLSKEFGSGLKYSQTSDQAQPHDGSKHVGIVSDHVDEGPIAASYGGSRSRNDGHNKAESVSENIGHIISMLSYSKEHNSNGTADGAYDCNNDIVNSVLPSSEGKMCNGKTLDASIREAAVLSNPDCGLSLRSKASGSSDGMDASLNSQLSPDPIPSATAVCIPNCDTVQIHEANENSGLDRLATFSLPFSDDRRADGATGILSEREVPVETIGTVFLTDCPKNAMPSKPPSSVEQRFDEGASNVLDGELSRRPSGTASPSHGSDIIYDANSLSTEQQTLGEISTEVLENIQGVNECYNDKENQTDGIMLKNIASSDQMEGISRTIPVSCSYSQQPLVISSPVVAVNEVPQDLCTSVSTSNKFADEDIGFGVVQNSSQKAERLSSPDADADVAIQSNPESLAIKTIVQEQQLSSAKFPFSNQDAIEKMQSACSQVESVPTPFSTVPVTQTNTDSLHFNSLEQLQRLHSEESPLSNRDLAEEVQNFSQEVEALSNPVDVVLPNQSNCESLVTEPLMEEQQLPTSESPSSNQDIAEEMHNSSLQDGQVIANLDLVKGLLPVEHPSSNENAVEEMQNSSQQIGSACCPVDYSPHARANGETLVMEPLEHSQQLVFVELPSSNLRLANLPLAPTTEDQRSNGVSSPVDDITIQSNPGSLVMETTLQEQQLSNAKFPFSNHDATEKMQNACPQVESVSTPFSTVPCTQTNTDSPLLNSLEQVKMLHSKESPLSNRDLAEEVQNFSQEVEALSNPVDVILPNQSNCKPLVMEPLMEEQQFPTSESPSSNQDIVEGMHNPSLQDGQVMAYRDPAKGLLLVEHPSSNENTVEEIRNSSQQIGSACCPVDYTPHARATSETLVMEPLEHSQLLVSVGPSSNLHLANSPVAPTTEDQCSNQVSNPVDDVNIQSNPESLAIKTIVQEQQLSSAKFPFSNQDAIEKMQSACSQVESVPTPFSTVPVTQTNTDSLHFNSLEQLQRLHSEEAPLSNRDLAEEVQNFSQEVEALSNPVDVVLPNQSNCESLVMEPLMEEQQLPTSESPSSSQDIVEEMHNPSPQVGQVMANRDPAKGLLPIEHPSSNENTVEELQNSSQQIGSACCPVEYTPHARSNSETVVIEPLEHSQQLVSVKLPSSNLHLANLPLAPTTEDQQINEVVSQVVMQLDSMMPTGGRTHLSNTIYRSSPEISSQSIQAATQSASSMPPPLYIDPFEIEVEKIRKEICQAVKDHENVKLQLKSDQEKELKETVRKYSVKLQEIEVENQQKVKSLDANIDKTLATMELAKVMRSKCWGPKIVDAMGIPEDANFAQQSVQLQGEQSAVRSSLVVGPSSCMPPATTLQSGFAMAGPQLVGAPIQYSYGTTGNFSNVSARSPQVVGNIHAFAPYPQLYRSLTSVPSTSHLNLLRGMSNQLVPSNIPATSLSFPYLSPQPTPPTYQVDAYPRNRGHWPFNFYGMNNHVDAANQFGLNLPNFRPHG